MALEQDLTYAHPEVLVATDWVKINLGKPGIKLIELDADTRAYNSGHISGAVGLSWQTQLQDQVCRNIISKEAFEKLAGSIGISPADTVVFYGDNNNWFAVCGFWLFKIYGHERVCLMDGGRFKWLNEPDKELTIERPKITPTQYRVTRVNVELRAGLFQIFEAQEGRGVGLNLIDVRSPAEFTGKVITPPGATETVQRGGHIPGAKNIPWNTAINQDGTFKKASVLRSIYLDQQIIDPKKDTVVYCRIGERSSHTWFMLKYLIGLDSVKNYDGSWTEYGNLVGVPIQK